MLHASARGTAREMVEEDVLLEGAVVHPSDSRRDDSLKGLSDLIDFVIGGIGIDNDAEMRASFIEIRFLECADFYRRVHQAVVIFGDVSIVGQFQWDGYVPGIGDMAEIQRQWRVARVHGI